ncbi:MAG: DUF4249 domain-containing protein [Bacteroidia bacterium]|jgi:hypothetical protein
MKIKFLAFLSILASVLVSCQDVVQFQVEELDPKIVVEGQVSNNPQDNYIKLTYNQEFYDSGVVKPATGLTVTVFDQLGNVEVLVESPAGSGVYPIQTLGVIGRSYALSIKTADKEYRSEFQELLPKAPLNYLIQHEYNENNRPIPFIRPGIYALFGYTDNGATQDYSLFRLAINDTLLKDLSYFTVVEDRFINGSTVDSIAFGKRFKVGEKVTIEHRSLSKGAYDFLNQVGAQLGSAGSPFEVPPGPIRGNLRNVANQEDYCLGWFGVCEVRRDTLLIR